MLHRLVAPAYFGGLPAGYDFINDPAANGDAGVPAPADGKKGPAPAPGDQNEGTYFVAFKEPAQAGNVNRLGTALAQNTDELDDQLRRDLAVPTSQHFASPGAPTSSFQLTGTVFVGSAGHPDSASGRAGLIQLRNSFFGFPHVVEPIPSLGFEGVRVTDIEAVLSGGTVVGNGYQVDPVISVSPPLPAGSGGFDVYFGVRGNPATQPEDMLSFSSRGNGSWEAGVLSSVINLDTQVPLLDADNAKTNTANTFQAFDQTFDGTIVRGSAAAEIPLIDANTAEDQFTLLAKMRSLFNAGSDLYVRIYHGNHSVFDESGLVFTYNCEWDPVNKWWEADQTPLGSFAAMLTTFGLRVFNMTSGQPANWGGDSANPWEHLASIGSSITSGNHLIANGNVRATDDFLYEGGAPTRTKLIQMSQGSDMQSGLGGIWEYKLAASQWIASGGGAATAAFPLAWLPKGAVITRLRSVVNDGGSALSMAIQRRVVDFTTPAFATNPPSIHGVASTAAGVEVLDTGAIAEVHSPDTEELFVVFVTGVAGGQAIDAIEVTYTDPGPRNF